ncbi:MAG: tetratricopeptide repeat protein [Bacteroidetes bacterium]|nr:tetratricopeptide repeat protein [Bacteroidota bacterium]
MSRFLFCAFLIGCFFLNLPVSVIGQSLSKEYQLAEDPALWVLDQIYRIRTAHVDSAEYYLQLAIGDLTDQKDTENLTRAYKERGILHYYTGNYDQELADLQQALQFASRTKNGALEGDILKELALTASRQGDLKLAKYYGRRAVKLCKEAGDASCLASAQRNTGRIYLKTGPRDSAVYFLEASYHLKQQLKDTVGLSYALNDLAELAAGEEDYQQAISYLQQSADMREKAGDSTGLAISINNIGEMYLQMGNQEEARNAFEESLRLSTKLQYLDLVRHTRNLLGKVYLDLNDYRAAYDNAQMSMVINDSLYSAEKANAIAEMRTKYETEKKEQTIAAQSAVIRAQRLTAVAIVLGLLLIGFIAYYRLFQQRKYEREIAKLSLERELHLERERISRDLHDSVGSHLVRIVSDLDVLALSKATNQPVAAGKISDMRQFAQQSIRMLRSTIWALHQEQVSTEGLAERFEYFLDGYLQNRIDWEVNNKAGNAYLLQPKEALNLIRILQEATQNMFKYAQATHYQVSLEGDSDKLLVTICDDGKGFDLDQQSGKESFGLKNITRRAAAIQAGLTIDSAPGQGMRIQIELGNNPVLSE